MRCYVFRANICVADCLVGGDERVIEAHLAAVSTALDELERYTQARIRRNPGEPLRFWT